MRPALLPLSRSALHRMIQNKQLQSRYISTLRSNPHIYVHSQSPTEHILSFLDRPPKPHTSIGLVQGSDPEPSPHTLMPNSAFLPILHSVFRRYATHDPDVQIQARNYASAASGMGVIGLGAGTPLTRKRTKRNKDAAGTGYGGTSVGADTVTSAQRGGWIHISDSRCSPEWARVAWPEDIFGSLEVDGQGNFVDVEQGYDEGVEGLAKGPGRYQESGTYRICTREGILGISPYLRARLVERLRELDKEIS